MTRRYPASAVFYRSLARNYPKIVRGEGCWLFDDQGKAYLDAVGGAFVANLGHGNKEVARAIGEQAARVAYVNGTAFTTDAAEALALELVKRAPGMDHAYFLSSGSEAVEAALKLARQHWVESGSPGKHKIIARAPGYHGNTLLALSASAREHYKKMYGPYLHPVVMIPAPYPYRGSDDTSDELEKAILREGADTVSAFIMEPVGGSSTGASVHSPDYLKKVRAICDKHGVLLIIDEVLTGAGRTGKWLAYEHYGVSPDILTMGKGVSGGYVPLSAVLASRKVIDPIAKGSGVFKHAQTFSHAPIICAAGLAAVRHIEKEKLVERCAKMGEVFHDKLKRLLKQPAVGDVRGLGLLAGVELVADKKTKAPFPRKLKVAEAFTERALELGLVVWPNVGQAAGEQGDIIMLAPPFTVSEAELETLVSLFEKTLEAVHDHCRPV